MATEVRSVRRYYLVKRLYARQLDLEESIWKAKQDAQLGESLPSNFPHRSALAELGYSAVEDLDGADIDELNGQGFTRLQAQAIFAALTPLI